MKSVHPSTIVATAGRDNALGAVTPPLCNSDTYGWDDPDHKPEYDYSRTVNPNRDQLVDALAKLEDAAGGVITGSGQSAALLALLLLPADALVIAPHDCYGGTYRLIEGLSAQGRLRCAFVDMRDDTAFAEALEREPALVWIETPSNPLLRLTDIAKRTQQARAAGALTLTDNTVPTPCRQRPLDLGCDLVLHSTTKALNGHGDLFGGALLAREAELIEQMKWWANAAGIQGSAHDAWQTLRGLRTLPLRVVQQEASAKKIASYLADRPEIGEIVYPGLADHPDHALAVRQQSGPGFMLSFRLAGGAAASGLFLKHIRLVTLASSLGGFSTLICQPSSMTHRGMPEAAQKEAGIAPDLLRLSVGLEEANDIIADLGHALSAV